VAGLKRITAKQLGLAAETISILSGLIEHRKARYTALLPPARQVRKPFGVGCSHVHGHGLQLLLKEFDKIEEACRKHVQDIDDKLLAIMSDIWSRSAKVGRGVEGGVDWTIAQSSVAAWL